MSQQCYNPQSAQTDWHSQITTEPEHFAKALSGLKECEPNTLYPYGIYDATCSRDSAWVLAWLLASVGCASALSIILDGSCSYFGETLPPSAEIISSTDNVGALIQRIVDASGLARNFEVRAALVPNASAVNLGSTRYILYNPSFMNEITTTTQDRWASAAILAHEIRASFERRHSASRRQPAAA